MLPQLTCRDVIGTRRTPRRHTRNVQQSLKLKPLVSSLFQNNQPVHPSSSPFQRNPSQIGVSVTEAEEQVLAVWDRGFVPGKGHAFGQCGCLGQPGRTQHGEGISAEAGCAVGGLGPYEHCGEAFSQGQGHPSQRMVSHKVSVMLNAHHSATFFFFFPSNTTSTFSSTPVLS